MPVAYVDIPAGVNDSAQKKIFQKEIRLPSGTKIYNNWVLTFFWDLPLDHVGLGDLIAAENPLVLESLPPQ